MWVALWWMKTWRLRTDRLIVGIYTSNWESGGCVYCRPVLGFFSFFLVPPPPRFQTIRCSTEIHSSCPLLLLALVFAFAFLFRARRNPAQRTASPSSMRYVCNLL